MFALIGAVLALVGLFMTLASATVPGWLLWAVLACISLALLLGTWPINLVRFNAGRNR